MCLQYRTVESVVRANSATSAVFRYSRYLLMLSDAIQKLSAIVIDRVKDLGTENVVNAIKEGRAPHTAVKAVVNGKDD